MLHPGGTPGANSGNPGSSRIGGLSLITDEDGDVTKIDPALATPRAMTRARGAAPATPPVLPRDDGSAGRPPFRL